MNDVEGLIMEIKRAASLYIAAKAAGDCWKMINANEKLADLSSNYLERGGSIDKLAFTFTGEKRK